MLNFTAADPDIPTQEEYDQMQPTFDDLEQVPFCETCNGTKHITTSGTLYEYDGSWHWTRITIPCPDCTAEGAAWVVEDERRLAAEFPEEGQS